MDILFLLIPFSVAVFALILVLLWRAVDTGQFDDLEGPAIEVIADDDRPASAPKSGAD